MFSVSTIALKEARSGVTIGMGMYKIIKICREIRPTRKWDAYDAIDYSEDTSRMKTWLSNLLRDEPPPDSINGFWFGMFNPDEDGEPTAEMYLAGSDKFDINDGNWACNPRYWPNGRYSNSAIMRKIYRLAYFKKNGLQNDAEYPLCLSYALLLVAQLCREIEPSMLLGNSEFRGVGVGFDSGDNIFLGTIRRGGFELGKSPG